MDGVGDAEREGDEGEEADGESKKGCGRCGVHPCYYTILTVVVSMRSI